jgi:hypothetical protein
MGKMLKAALKKPLKKRQFDAEQDALADLFADVFHSFADLYKISPDQFLKKLARKGVVLSRVGGTPK